MRIDAPERIARGYKWKRIMVMIAGTVGLFCSSLADSFRLFLSLILNFNK
jgi:hypothetical protein